MLTAALLLATALTIEDYATMPGLSSPRWSPDGARVAYVVTRADVERSVYEGDVWVIDADGTDARQLTRAGNDQQPRWSPDGKRIAFLSDRGGSTQVYVIEVAGGEAQQWTREATAVRTFEWSPDGKRIAFLRLDDPTPQPRDEPRIVGENVKQVHLYVVTESGEAKKLTSGDFSVFSLSWMPDGSAIVFDRGPNVGLDGLYHTDIYKVAMNGESTPIVVRPGLDRGPRVSPDGKWIAFTTTGGVHEWVSEHDVVVVPSTGGTPRVLTKQYGRTAENITWGDSRTVWIDGPWNTTRQLFRADVDGTSFTNTTKLDGVISDPDVHGERAVFIRQTTTEPPELFVLQQGGSQQLTHHNDAYRDRELGETRVVRWKNPKDGLEIEGLLTLPAGYKQGQRVPLLTFMHGGPASNFDQGFIGYVGTTYPLHVFASHGFAVLRPNPRGSGAYGLAFRKANFRDWTVMPWLDVESGIDHLIKAGIADPKRLGLMGWSYGAYLAAWALATTDRFRAISIGAGITDLYTYHATTDVHDYIPAYFPGLPRELLIAQSPLWNLRKTNTKVLILQGENDERVPLAQSTMLERRLRELGVDVTLAIYPRSGHGFREPKLRMDAARRNVELFVSTLGE